MFMIDTLLGFLEKQFLWHHSMLLFSESNWRYFKRRAALTIKQAFGPSYGCQPRQ